MEGVVVLGMAIMAFMGGKVVIKSYLGNGWHTS